MSLTVYKVLLIFKHTWEITAYYYLYLSIKTSISHAALFKCKWICLWLKPPL